MTNTLKRNMLGVLLIVGLMVAVNISPANGEVSATTTNNGATVTAVTTSAAPTVTISQQDLIALKAALDGLQAVVVSLDAYVKKLPKDSKERALIAPKLSATLSQMTLSLVALKGTLAAANVSQNTNLVEVKPAPVIADKTNVVEVKPAPIVAEKKEVVVKPITKISENTAGLSSAKSTADSAVVSEEKAATDNTESQGILSSLKTSLNSPPGVIVLVVFAIIFGVVVFMRVSSKKEAQTT
ncbi:MAG: hypothetical protein Q8L47_03015 [bacterium]|nr:hypothetical protein [bacterium]